MSLSEPAIKKDALRLVLSFFKDSSAAHVDDDFDFLGGGGSSGVSIVREKTLEFLRRSNVYNNQDFDPDYILTNWEATQPKIFKATGDYTPPASTTELHITFKKGTLLLVEEMPATGLWKGKVSGVGSSGLFPQNMVEATLITSVRSPYLSFSLSVDDPNSLSLSLSLLFVWVDSQSFGGQHLRRRGNLLHQSPLTPPVQVYRPVLLADYPHCPAPGCQLGP